MKVKHIMAVGALTIPVGETVETAAKLMRDQSVGMLLVGVEGHVEGIVTDRDLAIRSTAEGITPTSARIEDYMTPDVISISPDADPFEASSVMRRKRIHRLPVVDEGKAIGVVSLTDVRQAMDTPLHDLLFGTSMSRRLDIPTLAGTVVHYFNHLGVATLDLHSPLRTNDVIHIVGHTTDLNQAVISMEIDHEQVDEAFPGDDVALKVEGRVRTADSVFVEIVK